METPEHESLARFAREHRVHYEVQPEVVEGAQRELVGVQLRLFVTAERSAKLETPSGPRWAELLRDLQSFAEQLVRPEPSGRVEIVPAAPKLYQSPEEPDADEVALTLRVHCDSADHRRPEAGEDPCLAGIRERLEAIGVPRR